MYWKGMKQSENIQGTIVERSSILEVDSGDDNHLTLELETLQGLWEDQELNMSYKEINTSIATSNFLDNLQENWTAILIKYYIHQSW